MGKYNINDIVAGHISKYNIKIKLIIEKKKKKYGQIEVVECSGFRRFRR